MRKQQYKSIVIYFVGNRFDYVVTLEITAMKYQSILSPQSDKMTSLINLK